MSRVTLLPTRGGRFLIRGNHELVLYSPQFKELARFPLDSRSHEIHGRGYVVQLAPGPGLIAIQKWFDDDKKVEITWLDADTLTPKRSRTFQQKFGYEAGGMFSLSASRDTVLQIFHNPLPAGPLERKALAALGVRLKRASYPPSGLYVRDPDGIPRRVLADASPLDLMAVFVTNDTILVSTPHALALVSEKGRILFNQKLPKHEYTLATSARMAARGNRLAVPVLKMEGVNNEMFHLSSHIVLKRVMIYDFPSMRLACELTGKHPDLKHVSAIALSPDGSQLALLRRGAVELYKLPR